ncbi:MAG: WbqC family protein [Candidatus Omnitrophica bacterium]|nr:WbqC family protein [Candidatus Omnitrophota bacterium]
MTFSAHQPQYLPWIGYFDKIAKSDQFVFLDHVQYKKREFQNRNKIRTPRGALWLTVPVITKGRYMQLLKEVQIDNSVDWPKDHWASLKTNYTKAPFFKTYAPFFQETYGRKWESLSELNIHLIRFLLKCFGIATPLLMESHIGTETLSTDRLIELAKKLNATTYLSGSGGKEYLEEGKFEKANIRLMYQTFHHPTYPQLFMKSPTDFLPHLSAADLLFNKGGEAKEFFIGRS